MTNKLKYSVVLLLFTVVACKSSKIEVREANKNVPTQYVGSNTTDTSSVATIPWKQVFDDPYLTALVDSALANNQEFNILAQEMTIAQSEARARKGEYLPNAGLKLGAGLEKPGEFTRDGAVEEQLHIDGKHFPEPLGDFMVGAYFNWEIDVWKKLRNSKKAAMARFAASTEGRNFLQTELVSEIANLYYELLALDKKMEIVSQNISIQSEVLDVIKQQKDAARVTQLAVNRFEAQLLNTKNIAYELKQEIVETENKINLLVGRYPQPVERSIQAFEQQVLPEYTIGTPAQLLANRPDIRQAEQELLACKLDVKAARANFYPSFGIGANVGFQAFKPEVWFNPKSLLYNLVGDIVAPLINRNAIRAAYIGASAKQMQAVYNYERTILTALTEVTNQVAGIDNYGNSYKTKAEEVEILNESVNISNQLFQSARADYMEVLMTQREALESRMELIEVKLQQYNAKIKLYKALGGGWR